MEDEDDIDSKEFTNLLNTVQTDLEIKNNTVIYGITIRDAERICKKLDTCCRLTDDCCVSDSEHIIEFYKVHRVDSDDYLTSSYWCVIS